jgi:hypothetical protein
MSDGMRITTSSGEVLSDCAPVNLDRSLAFTALLELWPGYGRLVDREATALIDQLLADFRASGDLNMWRFAVTWCKRGDQDADQ